MFSERSLLALVCSAMITTIMTGLRLADDASWPQALSIGLGAGAPRSLE
ncbi:hypothetical protein ACOZ38_28380 [Sphaerisporangium viridialbum]